MMDVVDLAVAMVASVVVAVCVGGTCCVSVGIVWLVMDARKEVMREHNVVATTVVSVLMCLAFPAFMVTLWLWFLL